MAISFKQFLNEYRTAPLSSEFDKNTFKEFLADEEKIKQIRTHLSIPNKKAIVLYQYNFDDNDIVFILTDRQDKDDVVGYMFIHRMFKDVWQVRDVSIFEPYRNRGLGLDLYVKIINLNFSLINGYSQSVSAQRVWQKLTQFVDVKVLNIKTKHVESFSDKPKLDTVSDGNQEWFYIASSSNALSEEYRETHGDPLNDSRYERWLKADPTYKLHGFSAIKYGENDDF